MDHGAAVLNAVHMPQGHQIPLVAAEEVEVQELFLDFLHGSGNGKRISLPILPSIVSYHSCGVLLLKNKCNHAPVSGLSTRNQEPLLSICPSFFSLLISADMALRSTPR